MAFTFANSITVRRGGAGVSESTWSLPSTAYAPIAGAGLVVGFNLASTVDTVSTVTDNTTNVFKLIARAPAEKTRSAELWYCSNIDSASTRISVTLSGNSSGNMWVSQFEGMSTGTPVDQFETLNGTPSTEHAMTQITPTADNCLVVAFYANSGSTVVPVVFDDAAFSSNISTQFCVAGYSIQTVASTATGQWRTNAAGTTGAVSWNGIIASFFDTNAGGAGPVFGWHGHMPLMGVQ
jgi:hypothetical protein